MKGARTVALAAALVALALAAAGCNEYDMGVSAFEAADDGAVLAVIGVARGGAGAGGAGAAWAASPAPPDNSPYGHIGYKSADGGLSWSPNPDSARVDILPSESADTPRGAYSIGDFGVERVGADGLRETVYSTEYLRGDANQWLQNHETRSLGLRILATRPSAVFHHADSGNVIVAMGIQGAVVGTTDGRWRRVGVGPYVRRWRRVGVGPYVPADFSLSAKTRALWERGWFIGAIAAALSLFALTIAAAASACERGGMKRGTAIHIGIILAVSVAATLSVGLAAWGLSQTLADWGVVMYSFAMPAGAVMPLIMIVVAATFQSGSPDRHNAALIACVWPLPLIIALVFPLRFGLFDPGGFFGDLFILAVIAAAFIAILPPLAYHARLMGRHGLTFALSFLGMNALIALSLAVWLTLNLNLPATLIAIAALVGLVAVVLVWRVRGARRASSISPPREIL